MILYLLILFVDIFKYIFIFNKEILNCLCFYVENIDFVEEEIYICILFNYY